MHRPLIAKIVPIVLGVALLASFAGVNVPVRAGTVAIAPFTGRPDPTGASLHRPALTIKIDNTPQAHPQSGINQADVVYEEIVEGRITRLAAVFNSRVPPKVGPVRSVRRTDKSIVWPYGGIFAYSGGAAYAIQSISTAPVKLISQFNAGNAMFRDPTRYAPHNLYAVPARLFAFGGKPVPPKSLFMYRTPLTPFVGKPCGLFTVGFSAGYSVTYHWDSKTHTWDRDIFGAPDYTTTHARISPANVVVMWIHYLGGVGTIGAEGQLYGTGQAWVFTNGRWVVGRWVHGISHKSRPIEYWSKTGKYIRLNPGQTWVELLDVSNTVIIPPKGC